MKLKLVEWWKPSNANQLIFAQKVDGKLIAEILKETEKAVLVRVQGRGLVGMGKTWEYWIPKSVISDKEA